MANKRELTSEEVDNAYEQISQMLQIMEEIYFKNIKWFEENDKEIYKLVNKEAKKILKDKSKEKYAVELNSLGALDIINRKNNKYFYNEDPFIYGDRKSEMLTAESVAFKGVGLGTHISSTVKFNKPKKILICEENVQIFRCSMYVIDYAELASISKMKFCINSKDCCKTNKYEETYKLK